MTFIEYSSAKYDNVYMRGISYYNEMTNVGGVFFVWYKISIAPEADRKPSETMLIFVIMGGQWMDGLFDEPSARAVNSPPPSCYKDSIEQVAPAMPRARHEPN